MSRLWKALVVLAASCVRPREVSAGQPLAFDKHATDGDEVELPSRSEEEDFCLLRIRPESTCSDKRMVLRFGDWSKVSNEHLLRYRPWQEFSSSLAACENVRREVAEACGPTAQVELKYKGTFMATDTRSDGSWVVVGRDRQERVALRRLDASTKPRHDCYEAKQFRGSSFANAEKPFDEAAAADTAMFCLPAVVITGHIKTGTTALWYLLEKHEKFVGCQPKELCLGRGRFRLWSEFITNLAAATKEASESQYILNGCLGWEEYEDLHILFKAPSMMKLYLTRRAPETIWSSWNYFCMPEMEEKCARPPTTRVGVHYRSPELFHELFMLGKVEQSNSLLPRRIPQEADIAQYFGRELLHIDRLSQTPGDVLLLAVEHREQDLDGFWSRLSSSLGSYLGTTLQQYEGMVEVAEKKINTNDNKFFSEKDKKTSEHAEGEYQITKYRAMLQDDVEMIMKDWTECPTISQRTGWDYGCQS